ncbi:MAG: ROK family transcriptional regulator [Candidatus Sumerlaeia bacterium]
MANDRISRSTHGREPLKPLDIKFNIKTSAKLNRALVLRLIKENPRISRSDLANLTGLTRAAITHILSELIDSGLVREVELAPASSSGGRRAILLELVPRRYCVMGISMEKKNCQIVITDLLGNVMEEGFFQYNKGYTPARNLIAGVKEFIADKAKLREILTGIGIAAPGIVNPETNEVLYSHHFQWIHVNFADEVSSALGLPVYVENNANAAAIAEFNHPDLKKYRSIVYILMAEREAEQDTFTGLGAGVILNGEIYHGEHWSAGEMFQTVNAVLHSRFVEHPEYENVFPERRGGRLLSKMLQKVRQNNPAALDLCAHMGREVGLIAAHIADILDPGVIVIGGHPLAANDFFCSAAQASFKKHHSEFDGHVEFILGRCDDDIVARGAAHVVLNRIFIPIRRRSSLLFT